MLSLSGFYRFATLAGFVAAATWPGLAFAVTQQGMQMMRNWTQADRCAAAAHKAYPDNNAQSLAKRDQALQECLANSGIFAPRAPLAPPQ